MDSLFQIESCYIIFIRLKVEFNNNVSHHSHTISVFGKVFQKKRRRGLCSTPRVPFPAIPERISTQIAPNKQIIISKSSKTANSSVRLERSLITFWNNIFPFASKIVLLLYFFFFLNKYQILGYSEANYRTEYFGCESQQSSAKT